jgi:Mg-chelatase subunit ChlD
VVSERFLSSVEAQPQNDVSLGVTLPTGVTVPQKSSTLSLPSDEYADSLSEKAKPEVFSAASVGYVTTPPAALPPLVTRPSISDAKASGERRRQLAAIALPIPDAGALPIDLEKQKDGLGKQSAEGTKTTSLESDAFTFGTGPRSSGGGGMGGVSVGPAEYVGVPRAAVPGAAPGRLPPGVRSPGVLTIPPPSSETPPPRNLSPAYGIAPETPPAGAVAGVELKREQPLLGFAVDDDVQSKVIRINGALTTNMAFTPRAWFVGDPLWLGTLDRGNGQTANAPQPGAVARTSEPERFALLGDQSGYLNAGPNQSIGGYYFRFTSPDPGAAGAKDAPPSKEKLTELAKAEQLGDGTTVTTAYFDAEGKALSRDSQRGSERKSDKKPETVLRDLDGDVARNKRVEIALPDSERGQSEEKLRIATGPIVISEIMANEPATGLPTQKQEDVALAVEEGNRRQIPSRSVRTPAPQVAQAEKLIEQTGKPNDPQSAKENSSELVALSRELDNLRFLRDKATARVLQEKVDATIPKSGTVEVIDAAEAKAPEKPSLWGRFREIVGGNIERSARISVQKDAPDIAGIAGGVSYNAFDPYWVQTESEKIQSKAVLEKVVDQLNLNETWGKSHGGGDKLQTEETLRLLKKKIEVRSDPKTGLIDIRAKSDSPEEAARIANTVAQVYRDARLEQWKERSHRGLQAIEAALVEQNTEIARVEQELELRWKELSPTLEPESLRNLESYRIEAAAGVARMEATLQQLTNSSRADLKRTVATLTQDSSLQKLLEQLSLNETQLAEMTNSLAPGHPGIKLVRDKVAVLNGEIDAKLDGMIDGLRIRLDAGREALETLTRKLDEPLPKLAAGAPTPQPEVATTDNAFSTFSLNVSDVSFKLAAASLEKGQMPDPATVRSEEFINAFDYRDPEPKGSAPIALTWERARYPFAHDRDLLRFSVKTAASGRQPGRPLNLVLLLDNSGSMERADRVRIRQECLRVLASQLQPQDRVSVVAFARTARLFVDGLPGNQAGELQQRVGGLAPEGGTNLEDAMNVAYRTALKHFLANGVNRVVLLTDGAANLGDVEPESLKKKVEAHRKQGVALDCFGIGWDGLNDELLEALSRNGDGRYGFVNTPEAATTEFAAQLAGALKVTASDVKVQVQWNPRRVTAYRQIGYAKHQLKKEQFRDNTVDAAEIGAAEAGNALYTVQVNPRGEGPVATVRVRFKVPDTGDYREHEWTVPYEGAAKSLEASGPALRLAASASAFSEWLVSSPFAAEVTPDKLLAHLSGVPETWPADPRPKNLEWMIRQAKSIAGK